MFPANTFRNCGIIALEVPPTATPGAGMNSSKSPQLIERWIEKQHNPPAMKKEPSDVISISSSETEEIDRRPLFMPTSSVASDNTFYDAKSQVSTLTLSPTQIALPPSPIACTRVPAPAPTPTPTPTPTPSSALRQFKKIQKLPSTPPPRPNLDKKSRGLDKTKGGARGSGADSFLRTIRLEARGPDGMRREGGKAERREMEGKGRAVEADNGGTNMDEVEGSTVEEEGVDRGDDAGKAEEGAKEQGPEDEGRGETEEGQGEYDGGGRYVRKANSEAGSELSSNASPHNSAIAKLEGLVQAFEDGKKFAKLDSAALNIDEPQQSQPTPRPEAGPWKGSSQGPLAFRKRPGRTDSVTPGRWSYSSDGVERQSLKNREVGDLHFSPGFSGGEEHEYWVVIGDGPKRWVSCVEGQRHPTMDGYVLRSREDTKPPAWVRAQTFRANKCQKRKSP
ncbi:hypothetical protein RhiJN_02481 [Ceratobasidium sp. AG-Ba]|nr:hypothetical protein RhiJN_02481 [Ceratobasidium sp. AG-Ba]QRW03409.1 hypothetical protein RhiLY_02408 [Ceratobasidium sp. AG-Ba]